MDTIIVAPNPQDSPDFVGKPLDNPKLAAFLASPRKAQPFSLVAQLSFGIGRFVLSVSLQKRPR